jgi:hypothetical protein
MPAPLLQAIARSMPHLTSLDLTGCGWGQAADLQHLTGLTVLRHLALAR